jgi:hypothetical protein
MAWRSGAGGYLLKAASVDCNKKANLNLRMNNPDQVAKREMLLLTFSRAMDHGLLTMDCRRQLKYQQPFFP